MAQLLTGSTIVYDELCSDFPIFNCAIGVEEKYRVEDTSKCLGPWISLASNSIPMLEAKGVVKRSTVVEKDYYGDLCRLDSVYSLFEGGELVVGIHCGKGSLVSYLNDRLSRDYTALLLVDDEFDFVRNTPSPELTEVVRGIDAKEFVTYVLSERGKADCYYSGELQGYEEVYCCLHTLKGGGLCIIRLETLKSSVVEQCLYLLALCFDRVVLFRPAMSSYYYFYGSGFVDRGVDELLEGITDAESVVKVSGEFSNWLSYFDRKSAETSKRVKGFVYNKDLLESSFQPIS